MLIRDQVLQDLNRRVVAERGVATTPVVKHLDVIEEIGDRFVSRGVARTRSFSREPGRSDFTI